MWIFNDDGDNDDDSGGDGDDVIYIPPLGN